VYAATIITQDAPRVTTNAGFNALLQRIQGLSPRLQGEPLLAVLARATAVNDTPAAVNAFTPVAQNFLNSGHSFPVSSRMVQVLLADGPAGAAVRAGGNVQAIAQQYGITNDVPLGRLQNTSVNGPAGAAVMAGGNVQAIAQQYGITNDVPLGRLQNIAARANH
jgi:hypothetical protein